MAEKTLFTCARHPGKHPVYVICIHVRDHGAPVKMFSRATPTHTGSIGCAACKQRLAEGKPPRHEDCGVLCAACCEDKGFVPEVARG